MLSVRGVYRNGEVKLKDPVNGPTGEIPVIITFLEELDKEKEDNKLDLDSFSFNRSREILKDYDGSLSEAVIEERRSFV